MTQTISLIETSFADAIAVITQATELPEQTRRHWATSLRQIAKLSGRPLELMPARYSAIRANPIQLHQVPAGLTAKTLANHKSNVKAALLWLAREKGVPKKGAPLSPAWEQLRAKITNSLVRARLSSFMRFLSANNVSPEQVEEAVVDRFVEYRAKTGKPVDDAFRRLLARAWNANVGPAGWPRQRLREPPIKAAVDIAWEDFPEGLRRDLDQYLQGLTRIRRSRTGQRIRPLKPSTIRTRRAELQAAARMAVKCGVPVEALNSFSALLAPAVVEKVLEAYWQRNGETPKLFTIDLAARFLAIAKETQCLDEPACERLDEMRRDLDERRPTGMTDKNLAVIRQVLTPGVWERVVNLPFAMMRIARSQQASAPARAALAAQLAVAIAILTFAPVRLANLTAIKLGFNLIKPDGPESNYWLVFPDYDVKNRVKLEYPLEPSVTRLIDEYVNEFRPALMRSSNEDWLFPGQTGGMKGKTCLSGQITDRIYRATGMRMTVHQFRHAAGAIILKRRPGEYELVRRLLGHRNVQTTIKAYVGLENIQASKIFADIVKECMADGLEPAA
jgi:integrase